MIIFPIHTWLLGQVFKVMWARSWWCVARLFLASVDHHSGQFQFLQFLMVLSQLADTKLCEFGCTESYPGLILPPPAQDSLRTLEEGPSSTMSSRGQKEQWWLWRCWWTSSMQTTVLLLLSSPAAPGYPREPIIPHTSLREWGRGRRIMNTC